MKSNKPLRILAIEFLAEQDTKESTVKFHLYILDLFFRFLVQNKVKPNDVAKPHIIQYKHKLESEKKSPLTIDKYIGMVRLFYEWLDARGIHDNVAAGIRKVKRYPGYRKRPLTKSQVIQLLSIIDQSTVKGKRDYAMINLMIFTGVRRCEINRLDVKDVSFDVMDIIRKGHTERTALGIGEEVSEPIHQYLLAAELKDDSPLFISLSNNNKNKRLSDVTISSIVKTYLRRITNDSRVTSHSLRHTFAIESLRNGATVYEVQQALGHYSTETTKIYLSELERETQRSNPAYSKWAKNSPKSV